MQYITLISDWKLRDPHVAMFKGLLVSAMPTYFILDITHSIEPKNINQTAFILKNSYQSFPKGTLHIILTNLQHPSHSLPVLVEWNGHFFIGEDKGVFSLLVDNKTINKAWQYPQESSKSILEKILEMAGWHFNGKIEQHCTILNKVVRRLQPSSYYNPIDNILTGQIVYITSSGNAVTNIPVSQFLEAKEGKSFTTSIESKKYVTISKFHEHYNEKESETYFLPGLLNHIEITMNSGPIAVLESLYVGDHVEISFK